MNDLKVAEYLFDNFPFVISIVRSGAEDVFHESQELLARFPHPGQILTACV